jgi:hypothetical protein
MVLRIQNLRLNCVKAILLLQVLFVLSACPRVWYLSVTDATDVNHPRLCFSRFENCVGYGVGFGLLEIEEMDDKGKGVRSMWLLERVGDERLNEITYGIVPKGYKEITKAKPLEVGRWYSVERRYYFRLTKSGNQTQVEVNRFEEFLKKITEERQKGRTE